MAVSLCLRHNNRQCWGREQYGWTMYQRRRVLAQAKRSAVIAPVVARKVRNYVNM
jgi:hypothetical protein